MLIKNNNATYNKFKVYFMKTVTTQLFFIEIERTDYHCTQQEIHSFVLLYCIVKNAKIMFCNPFL